MNEESDLEWLMIDASHCKVHTQAVGAKGDNQDMSRTRLNTKWHLTVDAHGMRVRAVATQGTAASCTQAVALIALFTAKNLLVNMRYVTNAILAQAAKQRMMPVIPPR